MLKNHSIQLAINFQNYLFFKIYKAYDLKSASWTRNVGKHVFNNNKHTN